MRLSKTPFGILYNFAPIKDQCEKYHLDIATNVITAFKKLICGVVENGFSCAESARVFLFAMCLCKALSCGDVVTSGCLHTSGTTLA